VQIFALYLTILIVIYSKKELIQKMLNSCFDFSKYDLVIKRIMISVSDSSLFNTFPNAKINANINDNAMLSSTEAFQT